MFWYIATIIAFILIILLVIPVVVIAEYLNGEASVAVKYGVFTFSVFPPKEKKQDKKIKKDKKPKKVKAKKKNPKKREKEASNKMDTLLVLYDMAKIALDSSKKPMRRLLKNLKIYDLELYLKVGGEDAEKVATNFSTINLFVHTLYSFINNVFTVNVKQIYIEPDFISCEYAQIAKVKVSMRPSTIIAVASGFGLRFAYKFLVSRIKNNKQK